MTRDEMIHAIVEGDIRLLTHSGLSLHTILHDIMSNGFHGYASYTERQIKELYRQQNPEGD